MFTGLVAELGRVTALEVSSSSCTLSVRAQKMLDGLRIGDSIAVNGACLTVIRISSDGFTADVMPETFRRTAFLDLKTGDPVNLERALRPMDRLDGHIVAGHVEGVGTIKSVVREENAVLYFIGASPDILRYVVEKGSIAVDGISLTVTKVDDTGFGVSVIPHTLKETSLGYKKAGSVVNLETDILARYVEKLLQGKRGADPQDGAPDDTGGGLTREFLLENGF